MAANLAHITRSLERVSLHSGGFRRGAPQGVSRHDFEHRAGPIRAVPSGCGFGRIGVMSDANGLSLKRQLCADEQGNQGSDAGEDWGLVQVVGQGGAAG